MSRKSAFATIILTIALAALTACRATGPIVQSPHVANPSCVTPQVPLCRE